MEAKRWPMENPRRDLLWKHGMRPETYVPKLDSLTHSAYNSDK